MANEICTVRVKDMLNWTAAASSMGPGAQSPICGNGEESVGPRDTACCVASVGFDVGPVYCAADVATVGFEECSDVDGGSRSGESEDDGG